MRLDAMGWNRLLRAVWYQAEKDLNCHKAKPDDYCFYKTCHECKDSANRWCLTAVGSGVGRMTSMKGHGWLYANQVKVDGKWRYVNLKEKKDGEV